MSLGSQYGGLNQITASYLWKQIGIPKFLYGSVLWKSRKTNIIELEHVQNIMLRIMHGLPLVPPVQLQEDFWECYQSRLNLINANFICW